MSIKEELVDFLQSYLLDDVQLADVNDWLSGILWDDQEVLGDQGLMKILGSLELLALEALEGLRLEQELIDAATQVVWDSTGFRYMIVSNQSFFVSESPKVNSTSAIAFTIVTLQGQSLLASRTLGPALAPAGTSDQLSQTVLV